MPENPEPFEWITTTQAAALTGYSSSHFRKLALAGKLAGEKIGRDWFFKKTDIEAFAAEMKSLGKKKHNPMRYKNTK